MNTEHTLTKEAFARGVLSQLQATGRTGFPSLDQVKQAAQLIVQNVPFPDPTVEQVTAGDYMKIGQAALNLWHNYAPGKTASQLQRAVFGDDAVAAYGDLLKYAMDAEMGSYSPGMSGMIAETPVAVNSPAQASTPMSQIENARRPESYAMGPAGSANITDVPTAATVGIEMPHPGQESIPAGGVQNSLTAVSQAKAAQYRAAHLQALKAAMEGGYSPGMSGMIAETPAAVNSPAQASTPMGQVENARRPEGYAMGPAGSAGIQDVPSAARVGTEMAHAHQESIPAGDANNSVTDASKVAQAVAAAFPALPLQMQMKVASVVLSYPPQERLGALMYLQQTGR